MTDLSALPPRVRALEDLERRHHLYDARVDGWSPWRVMRNPVHLRLMALPLAVAGQSNARRAFRALWHTLLLVGILLRAPRRQLLVKTCRSALRMPLGERFRDVYFDGLLLRGHTSFKLEEVNSPDFEHQASLAVFPPDLDSVVFTFWGRVLGRFLPAREGVAFCERTARLLQEQLGLQVSAKWLLLRVSTVYWQLRLYRLLLARVRPRAVLVADTGEYALRLAALRQRVRFIELQHGVFDALHPDAVPVWVEGDAAALVLPDVLACTGSYWMEQLRLTRQGRDHAIAVGNEQIDLARAKCQARKRDDVYRLVLSSQGLDSARLADWIASMLDAAPRHRDIQLTIKLHPVYDAANRSFDRLTSDARVKVVAGGEAPGIFDLLSQADLHLSIASACHFDAAALGVTTVVIPLNGHSIMLGAVDGRQILLVREPADVWDITAQPEGDSRTTRFAEPGFIENLERLTT